MSLTIISPETSQAPPSISEANLVETVPPADRPLYIPDILGVSAVRSAEHALPAPASEAELLTRLAVSDYARDRDYFAQVLRDNSL